MLWLEAPARCILGDLLFVKKKKPSLLSLFTLYTHTHINTRGGWSSCGSSWDSQAEAGGRPAAEHRASGFNEAPTLLDLREVSQSSVAKSTDGLWDCFVGARAQSDWDPEASLAGPSRAGWSREAVLHPLLSITFLHLFTRTVYTVLTSKQFMLYSYCCTNSSPRNVSTSFKHLFTL